MSKVGFGPMGPNTTFDCPPHNWTFVGEDVLLARTFCIHGRFVGGTFCGRTFCGRTFCRKDVLKAGTFCGRTFCRSALFSLKKQAKIGHQFTALNNSFVSKLK